MTFKTAGRRTAENIEAAPLRWGQRIEVARSKTVKRRIAADECAFKRDNRSHHVVYRDAILIDRIEHLHIFGDVIQFDNHFVDVRAHFVGRCQWHEHLVF